MTAVEANTKAEGPDVICLPVATTPPLCREHAKPAAFPHSCLDAVEEQAHTEASNSRGPWGADICQLVLQLLPNLWVSDHNGGSS